MKKKKSVDAYDIYDIASWQMELREDIVDAPPQKQVNITLPTLQRGFVWKPHQIEALWDSILRGYPIGSLLMSVTDDGYKDLLDGQQRCTSIALGFQNPLKESSSNLLNIKKESIPSLWIDLKPMEKNNYGLQFAIRVLTRSHPWGYKLDNHQTALSSSDRMNALKYYRKRCNDTTLSFSKIPAEQRTPWDAHFPIPLWFLFNANSENFKNWKKEVEAKIETGLTGIVTKFTKEEEAVDYSNVEEDWYFEIYQAVEKAKNLFLPEILVNKKNIEDEENSKSISDNHDATLFLRLNSSGTRISGQELIYSLLKASFPEAKNLVEQIGLNYLNPATVVNLFVRFLLVKNDSSKSYRQVGLEEFRKNIKKPIFKNELQEIIDSGKAKQLADRAVEIITGHEDKLPPVLYKYIISRNIDLFLILMVFLDNNKENIENVVEKDIRRSFLHTTLFCDSKKKRKIAAKFYTELKDDNFNGWAKCWDDFSMKNPQISPPLPTPDKFHTAFKHIQAKYIKDGNHHFWNLEWIKEILRENDIIRNLFLIKPLNDDDDAPDVIKNKETDAAYGYLISVLSPVMWKKEFLIIAQRNYFNTEFQDYMEFDGIKDTNRPWDWDHIYPSSWMYRKRGILNFAKWICNTNGNFRALSFNENRAENNNWSPQKRFQNNDLVQKNSFIGSEDLIHWLELDNASRRLTPENSVMATHFTNAVLKRIDNIYRECFSVIFELDNTSEA